MRAMRGGAFVEFEVDDLGCLLGLFTTHFQVNGLAYMSGYASDDEEARWKADRKFLVKLGFSGPFEVWSGGRWDDLDLMIEGAAAARRRPSPLALPLVQRSINMIEPRRLPRFMRPDPSVSDTLGWRAWKWRDGAKNGGALISPHQRTRWEGAVLKAEVWFQDGALRGEAGIHARLVPRSWKTLGWPDDASSDGLDHDRRLVTGIVERFGRFVLGEEGWRAEQAVIRELMAPSTKIGLLIEAKYPDVVVHYPDQVEEEPWTSERSRRSAKGKRPLLPSPSSPSTRANRPAVLPSPPPRPAKKKKPRLADFRKWLQGLGDDE